MKVFNTYCKENEIRKHLVLSYMLSKKDCILESKKCEVLDRLNGVTLEEAQTQQQNVFYNENLIVFWTSLWWFAYVWSP